MAIRRPLLCPLAGPFDLGRRLSARPGFAMLWDGDTGRAWLASDPVEVSFALDPEPELGRGIGEPSLAEVPRWVGVLPYEALRHERPAFVCASSARSEPQLVRPRWHRYGAVARVTASGVELAGDDPASVDALERRLCQASEPEPELSVELDAPEPSGRHVARIRAALDLIGRGELYQVNLARRFELSVAGSSLELLLAMSRIAPAPFSACLSMGGVDVVSTSPELLLELGADGSLRTSPIKGTRPRGRTTDEDDELARELDEDPKERAELAMIIDVERNDLGRIARTGSVRLVEPPRVVRHATIHHRGATLEALLRPGLTREDVLRCMLPSGSVTGAPKVRAMEVIAGLEAHRRGLYTGGFGFIDHGGGAMLGMAIRTLTRVGSRAHYFAGGGIVADSVPEREVEETLWKALQLTRLAGCGRELADRAPRGEAEELGQADR